MVKDHKVSLQVTILNFACFSCYIMNCSIKSISPYAARLVLFIPVYNSSLGLTQALKILSGVLCPFHHIVRVKPNGGFLKVFFIIMPWMKIPNPKTPKKKGPQRMPRFTTWCHWPCATFWISPFQTLRATRDTKRDKTPGVVNFRTGVGPGQGRVALCLYYISVKTGRWLP